MSKKRKLGLSFMLVLFLFTASVGAVTNKGASAHSVSSGQALSATQERAVVGGDNWCRFAEGVGVGLGIAGMLGCVPCAGPSALIALGVFIAC